MADRTAEQRARYQRLKGLWEKLSGEDFEGSEFQIQVIQALDEAREDARVAAIEGKGVWKGTLRKLGDLGRKHKRKEESELAALKRICARYPYWQSPKTGEIKPTDPGSIQKHLYARDHGGG